MLAALAAVALLVAALLLRPRCNHASKSVAIVVLGDIGRSPRIMYHASSFVRHGYRVHLIGHSATSLIPNLRGSELITVHSLPPPPAFLGSLPRALFVVLAPIKLIWGTTALLVALVATGRTKYVLVQVRQRRCYA
jgi:beta-1,4-mannosyltransferase